MGLGLGFRVRGTLPRARSTPTRRLAQARVSGWCTPLERRMPRSAWGWGWGSGWVLALGFSVSVRVRVRVRVSVRFRVRVGVKVRVGVQGSGFRVRVRTAACRSSRSTSGSWPPLRYLPPLPRPTQLLFIYHPMPAAAVARLRVGRRAHAPRARGAPGSLGAGQRGGAEGVRRVRVGLHGSGWVCLQE